MVHHGLIEIDEEHRIIACGIPSDQSTELHEVLKGGSHAQLHGLR
jgi:hypothetical protein